MGSEAIEITLDYTASHQVLQVLNEQRQSGQFCDVLLKCGENQLSFAHSCVLAAASSLFEGLMSQLDLSDCAKAGNGKQQNYVQLDVQELFTGLEHSFQDILDLIYLGQTKLSEEIKNAIAEKLDLRFVKKGSEIGFISSLDNASTGEVQLKEEVVETTRENGAIYDQTDIQEESKTMDVSFCNKCDLLFTSKDEFLTHKMLNCTRKFSCVTCGTMFSRVQALLDHLVEVRHGETSCSVCSEVSMSSQEMENHIQKHLIVREKPYFCSQCDSRFSSRNALASHIPKHSTETPYICQVCTKGFKWKHALTSHMVTHSSDKKFLCQTCGFATSHLSVFKNHQRIHTGQTMKCGLPDCTFETVRKQNLIQHQKTHSKEKPHQCEVCGKAFSLVKNMRRHMTQHDFTASRYHCHINACKFSTLRGDKFAQHIRKSHKVETNSSSASTSKKKSATNVFDTIGPPNKTIDDIMNSEAGLDRSKSFSTSSCTATSQNDSIIFSDVKLGSAILNSEDLTLEDLNGSAPLEDIQIKNT